MCSENLLHVYSIRPFLKQAFLGQNCAYYMQDFTVLLSSVYRSVCRFNHSVIVYEQLLRCLCLAFPRLMLSTYFPQRRHGI